MKNVFWFLLDGLSPDFLSYCTSKKIENEIDEIVSKGATFTNVACTAGGTHCSMHSIFTSMMPSINGATGWYRKALRGIHKEIYTLTDYFKLNGYQTFRYCDAEYERAVPMSGFDIWESSGYTIDDCLEKTEMMKCPRRDAYIREVNQCNDPKFVYHHIELLHELNGKMGRIWSTAGVRENVGIFAKEFGKLIEEYEIGENDTIVISSDHGVLTDIDFLEDGIRHGERQYEQSVKTVFSIIDSIIPSQIIDVRLSSLDEAPTIAELILGIKMPGQGRSLLQEINGEKDWAEEIVYREKGTYCALEEKRNPYTSDVFYVRDGDWKYVYGTNDSRCEWLMDLGKDKDYEKNLLSSFPDIVQKYNRMIMREMISPEKGWDDVYSEYEIGSKSDIVKPFFSIIVKKENAIPSFMDNLEDMAGPYYEIIEIRESFAIDEQEIRGEYIVELANNFLCSEYLLSDLYREIINNNFADCCFEFLPYGLCYSRKNYLKKQDLPLHKIALRAASTFKYDL